MRKSEFKGFSFADTFENYILYPEVKGIDENYVSENHDPQDSLLRLVYTLDERTLCPTGDLQYFVNPKANPEVKKFILDNLLMDVSSSAKPALPDGLSDDDIFALSRQNGESLDAYVERMNTEVKRAQWVNDEYKKSVVPVDKVKEPDFE